LGKPGDYTAKRPDVFFRKEGAMPEELTLTITPAPLGDDLTAEETWKIVEQATLAREEELRKKAKTERRKFLGAKAVLRQDPFSAPNTRAPRGELNPKHACKNKWLRIEVLKRCKEWLAEYRDALLAWRSG